MSVLYFLWRRNYPGLTTSLETYAICLSWLLNKFVHHYFSVWGPSSRARGRCCWLRMRRAVWTQANAFAKLATTVAPGVDAITGVLAHTTEWNNDQSPNARLRWSRMVWLCITPRKVAALGCLLSEFPQRQQGRCLVVDFPQKHSICVRTVYKTS